MEEGQRPHLCRQSDLHGCADRGMPPADPRRIFLVRILRLANVEIRSGNELDELRVQLPAEIPAGLRSMPQMRESMPIGLVVGGIDDRFALVVHPVSQGHAGMVEILGRNGDVADLKRFSLELVHMEYRTQFAERHRKIIRIHLAAQNFLERAPLSR